MLLENGLQVTSKVVLNSTWYTHSSRDVKFLLQKEKLRLKWISKMGLPDQLAGSVEKE